MAEEAQQLQVSIPTQSFAVLILLSKQRHAQLQMLAKDQPAADANSGECCICLTRIAVSLFICLLY